MTNYSRIHERAQWEFHVSIMSGLNIGILDIFRKHSDNFLSKDDDFWSAVMKSHKLQEPELPLTSPAIERPFHRRKPPNPW